MKVKTAIAFLALFLFAGTAGRATAQGATWEIKSDSLNLGEHAGHKVTITGVLPNAAMHGMKEDAKAEARERGMDKNSTEHGHMTVTNLKMVSETCRE